MDLWKKFAVNVALPGNDALPAANNDLTMGHIAGLGPMLVIILYVDDQLIVWCRILSLVSLTHSSSPPQVPPAQMVRAHIPAHLLSDLGDGDPVPPRRPRCQGTLATIPPSLQPSHPALLPRCMPTPRPMVGYAWPTGCGPVFFLTSQIRSATGFRPTSSLSVPLHLVSYSFHPSLPPSLCILSLFLSAPLHHSTPSHHAHPSSPLSLSVPSLNPPPACLHPKLTAIPADPAAQGQMFGGDPFVLARLAYWYHKDSLYSV